MPASKKKQTPDFEKLLGELDKIVKRMEQGDQTLDQTMQDFERGMMLSRQCQQSLDDAQQRVNKLVKKQSKYQLVSMEDEMSDEENEDAS